MSLESPTHAEQFAFPLSCNEFQPEFGMTKREYFATAALQGIAISGKVSEQTSTQIANDAVKLADALIAALNKP